MKDPPRLIHSNPEFARFVAASDKEEPATGQLEQALSLAAKTATTTRWSTFRWLRPGLAIGASLIGLFGAYVVGVVGVVSTSGSPERVAVSTPILTTAAPADAAVVTAAIPVATPVTTVSVNDLAPSSPGPSSPARSSPGDDAPARVVEAAPAAPAAPDTPLRTHDTRAVPKAHVVRAPLPPSSSRGHTSFSEELAHVSAARSALEAGDVRTCMREVDRYEERFRAGVFAHEMEVIRIEALAGSGEQSRTKVLVERFLASNPNSPYADLVRSLTDRTDRPPE